MTQTPKQQLHKLHTCRKLKLMKPKPNLDTSTRHTDRTHSTVAVVLAWGLQNSAHRVLSAVLSHARNMINNLKT